MQDLKLNTTTWDVAIENGDFVLVDGLEALKQKVAISLKMFKGEWFLDQRQGMPWLQEILGRKFSNYSSIAGLLRNAILKIDGVDSVEINGITYDGVTRALVINQVRVKGTVGEIELSEFIV